MWVILVPKRYKFWIQAKGEEDGEIGFPPFSLLFLLKRRFPFITRILPLASAYVRGFGDGGLRTERGCSWFSCFFCIFLTKTGGTLNTFLCRELPNFLIALFCCCCCYCSCSCFFSCCCCCSCGCSCRCCCNCCCCLCTSCRSLKTSSRSWSLYAFTQDLFCSIRR